MQRIERIFYSGENQFERRFIYGYTFTCSIELQFNGQYSKIDELVKTAKQLGYARLALTDNQVMYGVIPFYKACIKEGIQPIFGLTIEVVYENQSRDTFTLLAKNETGYETLLQLSTDIQLSEDAYLSV